MQSGEMKPKPKSNLLRDYVRFLTFRATGEEMKGWTSEHLFVGFCFTWLVGLARNWDLEGAALPASLGLYSLLYILFMAGLLFASAKLLSRYMPTYKHVLTMVALTSAPGLVYGIPVEKLTTPERAASINVGFLIFVATYRVALAVRYFTVLGKNSWVVGLNVLLTPVSVIILWLIASGRAGYISDLMGGIRYSDPERKSMTDDIIGGLGSFAFLQLCAMGVWLLGKATVFEGWNPWARQNEED